MAGGRICSLSLLLCRFTVTLREEWVQLRACVPREPSYCSVACLALKQLPEGRRPLSPFHMPLPALWDK